MRLTDKDLIYAATARCRCGAGVAYPLDHDAAFKQGSWICAACLKDPETASTAHDVFPFAFYKVREETSINNTAATSTRPAGTVARSVGVATCPKCSTTWKSEPYDACGKSHHWFSGPCPSCGYAVGGGGSWSTTEGPSISTRYETVVIEEPVAASEVTRA